MNKKWSLLLLIIFAISGHTALGQKHDAEVTNYSSIYQIVGNYLVQTDSITIQINNRNGDDFATFSLPYSKNNQINYIDAWIEEMNGRKIKIKDYIYDRSDSDISTLYSDQFVKEFRLKHNVYPYKVKCTYKTTVRDFFTIAKWNPIHHYKIPTRQARIEVLLPKGYKYRARANKTDSYTSDSTSKSIRLEWTASYNTPIKDELFAKIENSIPTVEIVPIDFEYGIKGSLEDWKSFGNWINDLSSGMDVLPNEEINKINALLNGITDKKEIVKILYRYLQDNTRYINVTIGVGGLQPHPASYVAKNKYGDCKALTNYMKALLKHAGIESIYTIVYAGDTPREVNSSFPSQQFNHVILAVPLGNDTIWLENTNNFSPFNYLGTFTQNRKGLLVLQDKSKLVKIPSLPPDPEIKKIIFDIEENGLAHANIVNSYVGEDFERYNQINNNFNQGDKDQIIRQIMLFDNYEVENWELRSPGRDSTRIELHASLKLNKFLQQLGAEYYFGIYPSGIPSFTKPSTRTYPVEIPYPININDVLQYNLPIGYILKTGLLPINIKSKFGTYKLEVEQADGTVIAKKKFELYPGTFSLDQYPEFYQFIEEVKKAEKTKLVIKKA